MHFTPAESIALGALLFAALQAIVASWRDIGPFTLTWLGAAVLLERIGPAGPLWAPMVLGALVLAAAGWSRGAVHGVGRAPLDGIALLGAGSAALVPSFVPLRLYTVDLLPAIGIFAAPGLVIAAMAGVAALDRPGQRMARTRWFRRVPIADGKPQAASAVPTGTDTARA